MSVPPPPPPPPGPGPSPGPEPGSSGGPVQRISIENGGLDRDFKDESPSSFLIFVLNIVNTLSSLMIGGAVVIGFIYANDQGEGSMRDHIYLCSIGYMILMGQAVVSINPYTGWALGLGPTTKKFAHGLLQVAGAALAIAGSAIRIREFEDNFETPHGVLGLIAMLLAILSLIGGIVNMIMGGALSAIRILHSVFGTATLIVAFITFCMGIGDFRARRAMGDDIINLCISFSVVGLVGIIVIAWANIFRKCVSRSSY